MKIRSEDNSTKELTKIFEDRVTPWKSIWLCYLVQALSGVQFSMYFTSMWPYFSTVDPKASVSFFGWINTAFGLGQMAASWLFGYWIQKTMRAKQTACFGLLITALGNTLYALIPEATFEHKWLMLVARLLVGLGSGNAVVLRAYCSMASVERDRTRAMALLNASYVLGVSLGPAIQAIFIPIGEKGFVLGTILINVYTLPPLIMVLVSLISVFLLIAFFKEDYAGMICEKERKDSFIVIPKYDRVAAFSCIYLWFMFQAVSTSVEITVTPLTMVLYNWNDKTAILNNGIIHVVSCAVDIGTYGAICYTSVGRIDKRKLMIIGVLLFIVYYIATYPWAFYSGPLDYIELAENSTVESTSISGGCFRRYTWCSSTPRIPLSIYLFSFIVVFGFSYPLLAGPLGGTFSEILGPRKQGMMQGTFEFGGCVARCIAPVVVTELFELSGYLWINVVNLTMLIIGFIVLIVFYERIVPLKLKPNVGIATPYKGGMFYRL